MRPFRFANIFLSFLLCLSLTACSGSYENESTAETDGETYCNLINAVIE